MRPLRAHPLVYLTLMAVAFFSAFPIYWSLVVASHDNAVLMLEVRDDGVGGVDAELGSGILGLTDRVEALGMAGQLRDVLGERRELDVRRLVREVPICEAPVQIRAQRERLAQRPRALRREHLGELQHFAQSPGERRDVVE